MVGALLERTANRCLCSSFELLRSFYQVALDQITLRITVRLLPQRPSGVRRSAFPRVAPPSAVAARGQPLAAMHPSWGAAILLCLVLVSLCILALALLIMWLIIDSSTFSSILMLICSNAYKISSKFLAPLPGPWGRGRRGEMHQQVHAGSARRLARQ